MAKHLARHSSRPGRVSSQMHATFASLPLYSGFKPTDSHNHELQKTAYVSNQETCFLYPVPKRLCACARLADVFRNDLAHSGIYSTSVSQFHRVKWKFHTQGEVNSSPAIVDGVIYIGVMTGTCMRLTSRQVHKSGRFAAKIRIPSSPAVNNGLVYFDSCGSTFYAVDAVAGTLVWKFRNVPVISRFAATRFHGSIPVGETMPDPFDVYLSSPTVWNGAVYFGSGDGNIYALDAATGSFKWKFQTGDVVPRLPRHFKRQTLYWQLGQLFLRA